MSKNRNARKGNAPVATITPQDLVQRIIPRHADTSEVQVAKVEPVVMDPNPTDPTVDTSKPGTRVIKLANSKTSVISPISRAKPTSQSVEDIKSKLDRFVEYIQNPANKDTTERIGILRNALTYCFQHQEDAVFDVIYTVFRKYRTTLLAPETALQGIEKVPSPHQERIQQIYTLFWHITSTTRKTRMLDLTYASTVLGNGNLIAYMERHMK